jgi:four helix bundle protein
MSPAERFEDLRIWQEARVLANAIYDATDALRDFDFRGQIRSAAVSVMNNVAEGFERRTDADFAHFLDVAKGSAGEVRSMLYLAEDRAFVTSDKAARLRTDFVAVSKGIAQLAKYLRGKNGKGTL